jgi:23S rRNA pseudouridine2605 synthase
MICPNWKKARRSVLNSKENENRESSPLRLQVYLAHAGAASRRGGEKLITQGRVTVNGKVVSALGAKVLPGDEVRLDGNPVIIESRLHYLALNKPPGYICSSRDPQNRPLALDLLPPCGERLYNVGRLDFLSSGLMLFTNDGAFAAKISHPASEIEKEYLVESTVPIPRSMVEEFAGGVLIDGILYRAGEIEKTGRCSLRIVLIEGKNREIRRVFSHFHLHAKMLRRIRIGPVELGGLEEGRCRPLGSAEIEALMNPG